MMTADSSAEAQLQQELREMFLVDTQQQLELYFDIVQQLQPASWIGDIQSIYRAIHTIKGGAVTVEANSMLYGAIVLEDLLSDLRYLEAAPPLDDGHLSQMLLEAGELLASCLEIAEPGTNDEIEDGNRAQLTTQRLQALHAQVKEKYLPDWNEMKQVHQEFAEQGFDLVVLDLEMELANIPAQGEIPASIITAARSTIDQLTHIGTEIELERGWTILLQRGASLIANPHPQLWRSIWLPYFQILKTCIKNSGEIDDVELEKLDALIVAAESESNPLDLNIQLDLADRIDIDEPVMVSNLEIESHAELSGLLDNFFLTEEILPVESIDAVAPSDELLPIAIAAGEDLSGLLDNFLLGDEISPVESIDEPLSVINELPNAIDEPTRLPDLLDNFFLDEDVSPVAIPVESSDESIAQINESLQSAIASREDLSGLLNDFFLDEEILPVDPPVVPTTEPLVLAIESDLELPDLLDDFFSDEDVSADLNPPQSIQSAVAEIDDLTELDELDNLDLMALFEDELVAPPEPAPADPEPLAAPVATSSVVETKRGISIPVPLERLDRSAQQVVDTLLTARAVMNASSRLRSQLSQLSVLTQESSQFVTRLRQLQDNYALLRDLSDDRDASDRVSIERYRQGYTTIVRLLENMLRMSELGQEIDTTTYQNYSHLEDLDRSILRLKDGIETSRLVPFRNLTQRARAILRDLTNRYGKPATLTVENEQVELDAGVVQQLEPALLHLLRNAYDHGLETAAQRLTLGKPERGTIHVALTRRGNLYRLEIEDDGAGIDAQSVQQIAKSKGFPLDRTSTTSELLAVLCQPGFSSSSAVSEVSGRGVGMDVVVAQIASMGGKLSLDTQVGRGTKFTIEIPAPQLLVPCVLFQVGDRTIAFPTEEILETALLSSLSATMSADNEVNLCAWTLTTSRGNVPGFDLANYWQTTDRSLPDTAVCIRTRQGHNGSEIWSIADDLLGQAELLINPLPSPLIAPAGLLGVSLQSDGRLISILDPIALTTKLATSVDRRATDYSFSTIAVERTKSSAPVILVVDDAALMRRRFEASLNTYGFITHTCNDGLEALNWLENNPHPDLMITDVEMPNMDGFTLIDRARQLGISIPILVVSSRSSEEWGKEARRLGATDYLNKGFATTEMIQKVNSLLGLLVEA
ncbi:response regulator [Chamaesiphon sp. OTE_20_metabat_361]|uniref:response regulator n=1 Tax=Chamaesiphon sp. OTE_20_metabat_361 TaxID=2964689 RepID=UPI00286C4EB0|nr:response regulator [Chamaesiphon sp. OTE_20_metabat_361]